MAHVTYLDPERASAPVREMYGQAEQASGALLDIFKASGHSPELLRTLLTAFGGLDATRLDGPLRELAYIAASAANACQY